MAPLAPFYRKYMGADVDDAVVGYDPQTGMAIVNGPGFYAGRKAVQLWQNRPRHRCGEDLGGDDDDDLSGADEAELDDFDDDLGAIDEEAQDLSGERSEKEEKKLLRLQRKAQDAVAKANRKLISLPDWRKKARNRWREKKQEAQAKLSEINKALKALRRGAGGGQGGAGDPDGAPEGSSMLYPGSGLIPAYPPAQQNMGVFAGFAPPGQQIELPITFDSTGTQVFSASILAATAAGTESAFSGQTAQYTYLDLQIVGVKVNAFLSAPLMSDGGGTPLKVGIVEQSAQLNVLVDELTVDGGLNMLPDVQTFDLRGPFGTTNEKEFSGLRLQDMMFANGSCNFGGSIQTAFLAAQAYSFSMRAAVIAVIKRDFRIQGRR